MSWEDVLALAVWLVEGLVEVLAVVCVVGFLLLAAGWLWGSIWSAL